MSTNTTIISSNFSSLLFLRNHKVTSRVSVPIKNSKTPNSIYNYNHMNTKISGYGRKGRLHIRHNSLNFQNEGDPAVEKDVDVSLEKNELGGGSNNGGNQWDWTTSFLLFGLWCGLMYYVFFLAPNQTPLTDVYLLKKLLNLEGDDGFQMNQVLVSIWYIMGLWPLVYSMLLIPTARSSRGSIPAWPFLILSFFGGAYVLIPYFVLWKPPPPPVEETELRKWPLNFLESKLTAGVTMVAGLGLIFYAGLSNGDDWKEYYQYFRESIFIHAMSLDFSLLSAFAPFWIYNDMSARKWYEKGSWLLPLSVIPLLGPALYLVLRPSVPTLQVSSSPISTKEK